jgi:CMP-N,N'-diacetyllegionaminic acid synthase
LESFPYKNIISIIPARGGSKGVSRKNIRMLSGKPLIEYTIQTSLSCSKISRTIVSTEDPEIKKISLEAGAQVIDRPTSLATDSTPTEPVISHVLENINTVPDLIVLLQPTAPLRTVSDIERGFDLLLDREYDAVMSITEIDSHFHPFWIKEIVGSEVVSPYGRSKNGNRIVECDNYYQRQLLPSNYYWKNGSIYMFTHTSFKSLGHRYGTRCAPLIVEKERSINIDTEKDFLNAEKFLEINNENNS